MNRARLLMFNVVSALAGFVLLHCDDSTPATPPGPDGQAPSDASFLSDTPADGRAVPTARKWKPTVLAFDLRPQPNAMFAPAPNGDPGFTVPLFVVQNEKGIPKRGPDVVVDSKKLGEVGFGCIAYKFSPANPLDPKGPGLTMGDMGTVLIEGYSGGTYLVGPPGIADAGIKTPTTCSRGELIPDSGLFGYGCGDYQYPATSFLRKTDTLRTSVTGGADVSGWNLKTGVSPYDDLNVKNDLWHVTPDMVDGSKDLTINFDCGGADCNMAPFVSIVIESSDGRDQDAAPASPFDFPPQAKKEFGLVNCVDFLPLYKNTYTLDKSLLAQIPPTWTDLRITVATLDAATGQVDDGQPILLGGAFARFGITHR